MKAGFIGFGKSANRYHGPFISMCSEIDVIGYYSRGNNFDMVFPKFKDLKRFETVDALLESEVQLIIITTPSSTHFQFAKKALLAGKHVLVEKPMVNTVEEAKELYGIARDKGVVLCPYQNRRFDSDFLNIKNAIENYDLGPISEIESNHTQYRLDNKGIVGDKYSGFIYGHAVHFVDQIISLYGIPDDVIYDYTNQIDKAMGTDGTVEDYYNIIMKYDNMRVIVKFNQVVVLSPPRWTVHGLNGTVIKHQIDNQERDLKHGIFPPNTNFGMDYNDEICTIYKRSGEELKIVQEQKVLYTEFYNQLLGAILYNKELPVRYEEAIAVLYILETIVNKQKYDKQQLLELIGLV